MNTQTLRIPDITCGHCAKTVRKALLALEGMAAVEVDIPGRSATMTYDPERLNLRAAQRALEDAGYPASEAAAIIPEGGKSGCCDTSCGI